MRQRAEDCAAFISPSQLKKIQTPIFEGLQRIVKLPACKRALSQATVSPRPGWQNYHPQCYAGNKADEKNDRLPNPVYHAMTQHAPVGTRKDSRGAHAGDKN